MHMSVNRIVCSVLGGVNVVDVNDKLLSNLYLSDTGLISRRSGFLLQQFVSIRQYFAVEGLSH